MDLIDDAQPGSNVPEFTVADLTGTVKRLIESELGYVRVRGEVGRVTLARSGHLYFDLKDDRNVLSCMTWKGQRSGLEVMPEEGMEVVAEGRMTSSGFKSQYALNAVRVQVAGAGALMAMLEKRRVALAAEGLFDASRKRPLPYLPEIIGVVTSPQGAVIRDILHRLRERFPRKVLIWPVAVQGAACAPEVARAIAGFNTLTPGGALPRPDLLIVARGGGSIEDLWGFNEEVVVRAAAESRIPLISAVGHETDTTLIDFASDKRAPTPTAAAEMAVPVRLELLGRVEEHGARLRRVMAQRAEQRRQRLRDLGRVLARPEAVLEGPRQRLDLAGERLPAALMKGVERRRLRLSEAGGALRPSVLSRGMAAEARRVAGLAERLSPALLGAVNRRREALGRRADRLSLRPVEGRIVQGRERLETLSRRLASAGAAQVAGWAQTLAALDRVRETVSYKATLARGYAVVRSESGVVTSRAAAEAAAGLEIEFADGRLKLGGAPRKSAKSAPPSQGSLFDD